MVIIVCYFLNFALFQLAYPFIPLYLVELGESQSSAIAWTGLGQAVGSLALMVANPIWGALGDRFGRKSMVIRAMLAGAVTLTIMGLSTQAWQLFVARVLQGLAGGSSPALLTLAAVSLPRAHLGMAMGFMQAAQSCQPCGRCSPKKPLATSRRRRAWARCTASVRAQLAGGNALGATVAAVVASLVGIPVTFLLAGLVALATGIASRWVIGGRPYTLRR